ncbi:MAG: hypothetical protein AAF587_18385 [Bacteroidota bacterium]
MRISSIFLLFCVCLPSLFAASAPDGLLILTHHRTKKNTVIPEGSEVTCILIDGTKLSGNIESFNEEGFRVDGESVRLAEVNTLIYKDPSRDNIRQLGGIGIVAGLATSLASIIYTGVLLSNNYVDGLLILFISLLMFPAFLLGLGLALLGHTPMRHDRYKLRKWYKAKIGNL